MWPAFQGLSITAEPFCLSSRVKLMVIGILAIQGDFAAHGAMLTSLGLKQAEAGSAPGGEGDFWVLVRHARQLRELDGLILPGGESTAMLRLMDDEFFNELREFGRQKPCFGTCAGAILMATKVTHPEQRSLGLLQAAIVRNAYGRQIDSSIRNTALRLPGSAAGESALETVFIRAPQFRQLGDAVEVLARDGELPVLIRQGHLLAATFHPELTSDARVHRLFLDLVRERAGKGLSGTANSDHT